MKGASLPREHLCLGDCGNWGDNGPELMSVVGVIAVVAEETKVVMVTGVIPFLNPCLLRVESMIAMVTKVTNSGRNDCHGNCVITGHPESMFDLVTVVAVVTAVTPALSPWLLGYASPRCAAMTSSSR